MKFFASVAVGIALLSTAGAIALPGTNEAAVEDHKHKHHHNGTHSQEIRHWTPTGSLHHSVTGHPTDRPPHHNGTHHSSHPHHSFTTRPSATHSPHHW